MKWKTIVAALAVLLLVPAFAAASVFLRIAEAKTLQVVQAKALARSIDRLPHSDLTGYRLGSCYRVTGRYVRCPVTFTRTLFGEPEVCPYVVRVRKRSIGGGRTWTTADFDPRGYCGARS